LDVAECIGGKHAVEAGETAVSVRIGDGGAGGVVHAGVATRDSWGDVLCAGEPLIAVVPTPLRRAMVRPRLAVVVALACAGIRAVDSDTHKIRVGKMWIRLSFGRLG